MVYILTLKSFYRWDGLMAVLEVLEKQAGEYLKETQKLIWKRVR